MQPKEKLRVDAGSRLSAGRRVDDRDYLSHQWRLQRIQASAAFGRGLTFIKPTPDDPTRPRQIWSQGETEYNHYWFPCYDHPNDFATTEMIATVEKPMMVDLQRQAHRDEEQQGQHAHLPLEDGAAARELSHVNRRRRICGGRRQLCRNSCHHLRLSERSRRRQRSLPRDCHEMVKFFSEKTGVKYPYAKYAQTMARDFGGGMENITATTQTDKMIHDARTELDQTTGTACSRTNWRTSGSAIYVTCRTWADIWLNESFATYFQAMWDEHRLGRDDFLYRDVKSESGRLLRKLETGRASSHRDRQLSPTRMPSSIITAYPRGGAVLHMLRRYLGEENWWRSINHYLTQVRAPACADRTVSHRDRRRRRVSRWTGSSSSGFTRWGIPSFM